MVTQEIKRKLEDYVRSKCKEKLNEIHKFVNEECADFGNTFSHMICEHIKSLEQEDKFIVNTTLFEKGNFGITMAGTCLWDIENDQFINIQESNENLVIVVSIWICKV